MEGSIITCEKLINDFEAIGIAPGDTIMLQSSLKSVGWVEKGAHTVIDALLHVLGEEGTLVVPTFTYSYAGREGAEPFHKDKTPAFRTGVISETLRRRSGALRSGHPAYSFSAFGKNAGYITENHPIDAPLGIGSPLYKLSEMGGKILLLGVGQDRNSLVHVAEAVAGASYQTLPFREAWGRTAMRIGESGTVEFIEQHQFPGCSYNFGILDKFLEQSGIVAYGMVGDAVSRMMKAQKVVSLVVALLEDRIDALLCERSDCECCTNRREFISKKNKD